MHDRGLCVSECVYLCLCVSVFVCVCVCVVYMQLPCSRRVRGVSATLEAHTSQRQSANKCGRCRQLF